MIYHIKRKNTNYMIISIDTEFAVDKIKYNFTIKRNQLVVEGIYFNITEAMYDHAINTIHKNEKLCFSSKMRNKTKMFTLIT